MHYIRWKQGDKEICVEDWETGEKKNIAVDPSKHALDSAKDLYNKSKKQKRAVMIVEPLLTWSKGELNHIHEVEESLNQLDVVKSEDDLVILKEIQVCIC